MAGQIARARHQDAPDLADAARDDGRIGQVGDSDREVEPLLDQVGDAIERDQRGGDLRLLAQESRQHRHQVHAAEGERRGQAEVAGGHDGGAGRGPLGLVQFGEQAARALQQVHGRPRSS